jgi:hypothetical protein
MARPKDSTHVAHETAVHKYWGPGRVHVDLDSGQFSVGGHTRRGMNKSIGTVAFGGLGLKSWRITKPSLATSFCSISGDRDEQLECVV